MLKTPYYLIALIPALILIMAIVIIMLIWVDQCDMPANVCDQSVKMAVIIAVTLAAAASVAAALVEGAFYHLQSKHSDENHEKQMRAIKRLENKIDKILGELSNAKSTFQLKD